jgi:peptidoglycan/xylan/chitin deacetylase (PgdA/CDA1 family)
MAVILLYHSVAVDVMDSQLQVHPDTILRHLSWCAREGYETAPLGDTLADSTKKRVAITFDDGFASFRLAWPALRARGIRPTIFVCPGKVGGENDWASPGRLRERLLDTPQICKLAGEGVLVGCHGWDHQPFLDRTVQDMEEDLARCERWFQTAIDVRPAVFAWPYGQLADAAIRVVARHHEYALAAGPGRDAEATRWTVPRIAAYEGYGAAAFEEKLDLGSFFLELARDRPSAPGHDAPAPT